MSCSQHPDMALDPVGSYKLLNLLSLVLTLVGIFMLGKLTILKFQGSK